MSLYDAIMRTLDRSDAFDDTEWMEAWQREQAENRAAELLTWHTEQYGDQMIEWIRKHHNAGHEILVGESHNEEPGFYLSAWLGGARLDGYTIIDLEEFEEFHHYIYLTINAAVKSVIEEIDAGRL